MWHFHFSLSLKDLIMLNISLYALKVLKLLSSEDLTLLYKSCKNSVLLIVLKNAEYFRNERIGVIKRLKYLFYFVKHMFHLDNIYFKIQGYTSLSYILHVYYGLIYILRFFVVKNTCVLFGKRKAAISPQNTFICINDGSVIVTVQTISVQTTRNFLLS